MKKTLLIMACVLATISFTLSSCSKEETKTPVVTPTDVRDQAVGTYTYALQANALNSDVSITAVGSKSTGVFTVEKGAITGTILIKEAGDLFANGNKVTGADNGFVFDLEPQVQDSISLTGFDYFLLGGGVKYNGGFIKATNTLSFAYKYMNTNSGDVAVLTWECTKIK
jgi:hypothetical protein